VNVGNLAIAVFERGDAGEAALLFEEALALARSEGDGVLVSQTLTRKGQTECRNGELESAQASLRESITIAHGLADPLTTILALGRFAELALSRQAPSQAVTLWGAVARLRDETGETLVPQALHEENALAQTRLSLGDDAFELARREGRAMNLDESVRYALEGPKPHGT